jgi:hypothetical protein
VVIVLLNIWSGFILGMALGVTRPRCRLAGWRPFVAGAAAAGVPLGILEGRWTDAGLCAGALIVLGWDWWNRRGRKVAKLIGEKSRALLAAIVERAREAGSPVPQGARA